MTHIRIALASMLLLLSAATPSHAELAPLAQQAISKGILAVQQQDYLLAIRYFEEARKIAPDAPEIHYNLGLAESKIAGRELRAIAWFAAYLKADPSAPNAAAVKDAIDALDVKGQSNVSHLITSVQEAVSQTSSNQEFYLGQVAGLWAGAGDLTAAAKLVDRIPTPFRRDQALAYMAEAQIHRTDLADALKTAEQIQGAESKSETLEHIAMAQLRDLDVAAALKTFALAKTATDLIKEPITRHGRLESIAGELADADDIAGAQKILEGVGAAIPRPSAIKDDPTMRTWPDDKYYIDLARDHIVKAQLRSGDIAGAQKTASLVQAPNLKPGLQKAIAEAITKSGTVSSLAARPATAASAPRITPALTARDWLDRLSNTYDDCPLNTDLFLDWASYLKAQHSDNPQILFSGLRGTAEKMLKAQNFIDRMLKRQAAEKANP